MGAAAGASQLSREACALIDDPAHTLWFSAASVWEVAIKLGVGREDFRVDPAQLRKGLLDNGYRELAVSGEHALGLERLPPIHKDPFDRMLLAQAIVEGFTLLAADERLGAYPGPIRRI